MKLHFNSSDARFVRWQQRGTNLLRQALRYLQRLLAVDRPPEALALVPIRVVQPPVTRQQHRGPWCD